MENVFFPNYTIGADAYDAIPSICCDFGKTVAIVGGKTALSKAEAAILKAIEGKLSVTGTFWYGGDCTFENAARIETIPEVKEADMVFAVGGGRAVDCVKIAAEHLGKPVFTFPTLASNCAPVTSVCAVYHEDHSFRQVWYRKRPPFHCFMDTKIIAEAPRDYFWAGIGDALSKQYEVLFSARGDKLPYIRSIGVKLAENCSEGLLTYGEEALAAVDKKEVTPALERVVQNIIISTGLISNCIPEDYNSSLAHALYNSHVGLPHKKHHLHGAVVCYGVLVLLTMDGQIEERNRVFDFCKKVNLPHSLEGIEMDKDHLETYLDNAVVKPDLRKVPYPVTKELIRKAILDLEEYNKTH